MSLSPEFLRALRITILQAAAATTLSTAIGCGSDVGTDDGQGGAGNNSSVGDGSYTGQNETVCIDPPGGTGAGGGGQGGAGQGGAGQGGAEGVGGRGGAGGGSDGVGGGGAAGGAPGVGGAGGEGGARVSTAASTGGGVMCLPPEEAAPQLELVCGYSLSSVAPAVLKDGQCCYMVISSCHGSGRPFLEANLPLTAPARRGKSSSWLAASRPRVDDLSPDVRAVLAREWLDDALLEHASVASFSRFALELMAVGAPADLLLDAHGAAGDEVRHAQMCFALASAYAGLAIEPAAMPFRGRVEVRADLADVAARAVKEGCVGETLAAALANAQRTVARDPVVRDILEQIAEDEARHAVLAWRFVAWAVAAGGADVAAAVAQAFDEALLGLTDENPGERPSTAPPGHGRLDEQAKRAVMVSAVDTVVRPALARMLPPWLAKAS